ncbi:ABC transporter permease [Corynebacterium phoceense]|uniref:FtsX-like permease family protein n=1 Tax=Corynebacterium phoceense TaxID=1686286 RepID=UPI00211BBE9F|nr:FtsX-like permease family protein [Corynebacterium phoceense]MCQ9335700.1 ABC transporter permease [Corynebacterium phoceense]
MSTATLTFQLHRASLHARTGTGTLSLLSILSIAVGSTAAFLVAGGTWMFWVRAHHPELITESMRATYGNEPGFLYVWFSLALFACAFIVPALFSLTAQAAVLGASGRERRLATLRLLGLSSRDVTRMTVIETGIQAIIGIALGLASSVLLAPVFTHLEFQDRPVELREILLPWWGYLAVAATLFFLALGAAFVGMQRVRVSPLGVARRSTPPALKYWRLIAFVLLVAVVAVIVRNFDLNAAIASIAAMIGLLCLVVLSINFVAPFLLQVAGHIVSLFPGTAHFVAWQRVATNGKRAWRRVASLAFFGFLAGYLVSSPLKQDNLTLAMREEGDILTLFKDISTGALLTLLFGFILTGLSIFLGQASATFEDAQLSRSLQLMGVPRRFHTAVNFIEIMGPAVGVSLLGFALGSPLAFVMFASTGTDVDTAGRVLMALSFLGAGWGITLIAALAAEPLRSRVLASGRRHE